MPQNTIDSNLDDAAIRAVTFVRYVEIHETLGSTNDRAAELARDPDIELPALIAARHQTAGRGRGKNIWWSADGALTFSVLLEPTALGISVVNWPQLSLATAVAVCDALAKELNPQSEIPNPQSARLGIKWPNDVVLNGAKVCGILVESPGGAAPAKDRLIIGIGINVNNSLRALNEEAAPGASALCDCTCRPHDLLAVLSNVLNAIAARLAQLRAGDSQLVEAWQRLDVLAGQSVALETDGRRIEGQCVRIAHDGALVLETLFGAKRLYSGSIRTAD